MALIILFIYIFYAPSTACLQVLQTLTPKIKTQFKAWNSKLNASFEPTFEPPLARIN